MIKHLPEKHRRHQDQNLNFRFADYTTTRMDQPAVQVGRGFRHQLGTAILEMPEEPLLIVRNGICRAILFSKSWGT